MDTGGAVVVEPVGTAERSGHDVIGGGCYAGASGAAYLALVVVACEHGRA